MFGIEPVIVVTLSQTTTKGMYIKQISINNPEVATASIDEVVPAETGATVNLVFDSKDSNVSKYGVAWRTSGVGEYIKYESESIFDSYNITGLAASTMYDLYAYVILSDDSYVYSDGAPANPYKFTTLSAGAVSYTCFFAPSYLSKNSNTYGGSFYSTNNGFRCDVQNASNNNGGWNYIKMGHKETAYVGTITTYAPIEEAIRTVKLTIDAVSSEYINSIKLFVDSVNTFNSGSCQEINIDSVATGDRIFDITVPTTQCYYKIAVDCKVAKSNGPISLSKVVFTTEASH